MQLHWLLILIDLRRWPFWINDHLTLSKMDSISRSAGERSGLISNGLASIVAASMAHCNLTSIGLGRVSWGLNLPNRKQSKIRLRSMSTSIEPNILDTSLVSLTRRALLGVFWGHSSTPYGTTYITFAVVRLEERFARLLFNSFGSICDLAAQL